MCKVNINGHFSSRIPFKQFPKKILSDNNVTYLMENYFQELFMTVG